MRIPLIIGNWKMNGLEASLAELSEMVAGIERKSAGGADCAICPPATLLHRAVATARGRLAIGGQDCAVAAAGAHTGDVSAEMLRDAGASLVIVGHSERRRDHGETDALVCRKAEAAFRAGLIAVVCIGESEAERAAGRTNEVLAAQVAESVPPGSDAAALVVAYEPVWAIGTGRTPTDEEVAAIHRFIRERLRTLRGPETAGVRILHGGSVTPANAAAMLAIPDVDGVLIGGRSLTAKDFLSIVGACG